MSLFWLSVNYDFSIIIFSSSFFVVIEFQVGQRRMDLMWLLVREEETVDAGDTVEVSIGE